MARLIKGYVYNYWDDDTDSDMEWEVAVRGKKLTFKQGPYGKRKVIGKESFESEEAAREAADEAAFSFCRRWAFTDVWNTLARSMKKLGDGPYTFDLGEGKTTEARVAHAAASDDLGFVLHRAFSLANGDEVVLLWAFCDLDGLFILECSKGAPSTEALTSSSALPYVDDVESYAKLGRIEKLRAFREHVPLETIAIETWPTNEAWKTLFRRLS